MKKIIKNLNKSYYKWRPSRDVDLTKIHFLHIGKNAGTQIKLISEEINEVSNDYEIIIHKHDHKLINIPKKELYFFSIRHPFSRFKSGFYSRKRKGYPRHYSDWSSHEKIAFQNFHHANDLAESLFENSKLGERALSAIKTIRHTSQMQISWFDFVGSFMDLRPPLHIIRQECFEADIKTFTNKLNLEQSLEIHQDPIAAHKNDYSDTTDLTAKAKEKLSLWYAQDIYFYEMCCKWIEQNSI